jgi:hypothetical protein
MCHWRFNKTSATSIYGTPWIFSGRRWRYLHPLVWFDNVDFPALWRKEVIAPCIQNMKILTTLLLCNTRSKKVRRAAQYPTIPASIQQTIWYRLIFSSINKHSCRTDFSLSVAI